MIQKRIKISFEPSRVYRSMNGNSSRKRKKIKIQILYYLEQFRRLRRSFEKRGTIEIHSIGRQRKFIPRESWALRFLGVDSRVLGNQSKVPLVSDEQSIMSYGLPKCRYSRLVQVVSFYLQFLSVAWNAPDRSTKQLYRHFTNSTSHDTSREISVFFISSRNHCVETFQKPP